MGEIMKDTDKYRDNEREKGTVGKIRVPVGKEEVLMKLKWKKGSRTHVAEAAPHFFFCLFFGVLCNSSLKIPS